MNPAIPASLLVLALAGCASRVPYRNDRPMTPLPPGSNLVAQCRVTVQFNEDEASVPESQYLDSMFCLGFMEGFMGANTAVRIRTPHATLFCLPESGIKTWIGAKAVVEFADKHPELMDVVETEFAALALADKYPCNGR